VIPNKNDENNVFKSGRLSNTSVNGRFSFSQLPVNAPEENTVFTKSSTNSAMKKPAVPGWVDINFYTESELESVIKTHIFN